MQVHALLLGQVLDHGAGQGAVVDVGADVHAGRGDLLVRVAAVHGQRRPLADLRAVFAVQHALEQVFLLQGGVALAQVIDVVVAPDKGHVRHVVDKGARVGQVAVLDLVGPELLRHFELLVDVDRFLGLDRAVLGFRRVVQLHEGRVAGAGIVHRIRAFGGHLVEALEHLDLQVGLQFGQHGAEGGAHDAGADQDHVDRFVVRRCRGLAAGSEEGAGNSDGQRNCK